MLFETPLASLAVYELFTFNRREVLVLNPLFFVVVALQPNAGCGLPIHEVSNHTQRRISVGRTPPEVVSARRRDLHLTRDRHPCPRRDSNPQSQQESGRRPFLDRAASETGR